MWNEFVIHDVFSLTSKFQYINEHLYLTCLVFVLGINRCLFYPKCNLNFYRYPCIVVYVLPCLLVWQSQLFRYFY